MSDDVPSLDPETVLAQLRERDAIRPATEEPERVRPSEKRIKWLEREWRAPPDKPYSVKGREWVREFFDALEGFKMWPNEAGELCEQCADKVGEVAVFENEVEYSNTPEHRAMGCVGLQAYPIRMIFLDADRRSGKSVNLFGYYATVMHNDKNVRMRFLASGYQHTMEIAERNYLDALKANKALIKRVDVRHDDKRAFVHHPKRKNSLVFGSASHSANLGGSFDYIGFDECRAIDFQIVSALLPTFQENHGIRCLKCSYKTHGTSGNLTYRDACPQCGLHFLRGWNGRAVFMSNRSIIRDDMRKDWFQGFVDSLLEQPLPSCHVIKIDDNVLANPDIDPSVKQDVYELVGRFDDLKPYVDVEFQNEGRREGELYLAPNESKGMIDPSLKSLEDGTLEPVFFYVDTARVTDKVVVAGYADDTDDAGRGEPAWSRLRNVYLAVYDPKDPHTGISVVEDDGVRRVDKDLFATRLFDIGQRFPNLLGMWIDTRGSEFAKDTLRLLKKNPACTWSSKVHRFEERDARDVGYDKLHLKTLHGMIRVIDHPRLRTELGKAVWVDVNGRMVVRESNKSSRKRSKYHLEVLDAHAQACFLSTIVSKKASQDIMTIRKMERDAKRKHKRKLGSERGGLDERVRTFASQYGIKADRF